MVEYTSKQLDLIFHALADGTRRKILKKIAQRPTNVTLLAEPFAMSLNAVSKHLKVLEGAGLIKRIKQGRMYYCEFNHQPLEQASELIDQLQNYWEKRLDALETYFNPPLGEKK
jgi:DNA-binding transcriptional ArsR family regulator